MENELNAPLLTTEQQITRVEPLPPRPPHHSHFFRFKDNKLEFIYIGEFYTNPEGKEIRHGKGTTLWKEENNVIVGEYVQDRAIGEIVSVCSKNNYIVYDSNRFRTVYFENGGVKKGTRKDNQWHGHVMYHHSDGMIENVEYPTGPFIVRYPDGASWEGKNVDNKNEGVCIVHYPDGSRLEEEFVKGKVHGITKRIDKDGSITEETYHNGLRIGAKRVTSPDGTTKTVGVQLGPLTIFNPFS